MAEVMARGPMPEHRLSILHISDLHARSTDVSELPDGAQERRLRQVNREAASRHRVLGDEWDENLRALYPAGERPDLVCFTGDVADWGLRSEYTEATKLVRRLVDVLGIERSQIYVVPGNHDVRRTNPKRKEHRPADHRGAQGRGHAQGPGRAARACPGGSGRRADGGGRDRRAAPEQGHGAMKVKAVKGASCDGLAGP